MRILVRGTNWIGDAVMSIAALRRLRLAFPDAHIALHTRKWAEGIFSNADFIDEIISYEKTGSKLKQIREQASLIKQKNFDLVILFTNSAESAITAYLSRVPKRIGYATEKRGFMLTDAVRVPEWKKKKHEAYYYVNLVDEAIRRFGVVTLADENFSIDLPVGNDAREKAREMAAKYRCRSGSLVMLGAGSTNSRAKRWGAEKFGELARLLTEQFDADVFLLGANDEKDVNADVVRLSGNTAIDLSGETTLETAAALLAEADIFVSNDMGLSHLAPAVGTKTVVIIGPTDSVTTRPFSELAHVVSANVDCAPCMLRDCPIDHRCMTRVAVNIVLSKIKEVIFGDER